MFLRNTGKERVVADFIVYYVYVILRLLKVELRHMTTLCSDLDQGNVKEEIAQAYLVTKRSNEELRILEVEMTAVIQYWFNQVMVIVGRLNELIFDCEDSYTRGAISLFKRLKLEAELHHQKAVTMFSKVINVSSNIQLTSTKTYEPLETSEESESDGEGEVDSDSSETDF